MADSQFYGQKSLYLVCRIRDIQDVAQSVASFCKKVGKTWYFLSFKNNANIFPLTENHLNIASSIFSFKIHHVVGGRLWVRPNIVTAEYNNPICWTAMNTHLWERGRYVWRYIRTLQMAKLVQAIIRAITRADEVEILVVKEEHDDLTVFTLFDVRHFKHGNGKHQEFELRCGPYCVYISIVKWKFNR
jgi:hypothetical protein